MPCISVTITDITKGPFSLKQLFAGGVTGATISPVAPPTPPKLPLFVSIEADEANTGGSFIYTGDANLPATGTAYGRKLAPAAVDQRENVQTPIAGVFINASANGLIANVNVYGGQQ